MRGAAVMGRAIAETGVIAEKTAANHRKTSIAIPHHWAGATQLRVPPVPESCRSMWAGASAIHRMDDRRASRPHHG
jgi:hypothetical protein